MIGSPTANSAARKVMQATSLPSTISALESRVASRKSSVRRSFSRAMLSTARPAKTPKIMNHLGNQHPEERLERDAGHHVVVRDLPLIPVISGAEGRQNDRQEDPRGERSASP